MKWIKLIDTTPPFNTNILVCDKNGCVGFATLKRIDHTGNVFTQAEQTNSFMNLLNVETVIKDVVYWQEIILPNEFIKTENKQK